jgi:hypothetical protein
MNKYVYSSESGDDRNDGLTENTPVRSGQRAIKISLSTGREIRVLDFPDSHLVDESKRQPKQVVTRKLPAAA